MTKLRLFIRLLGKIPNAMRGMRFSDQVAVEAKRQAAATPPGPLRQFFDARVTGRGIWKFEHYFEIYERHFGRFVGTDVHVAEIGVYSGGSLEMWRHYFGPRASIYGIDIEERCRGYADSGTQIFIGDQSDRGFWAKFRASVPNLDILIDDGSHRPEDQIPAFEELFPYLAPGGVYLCEDIQGIHNGFSTYLHGLAKSLNAVDWNAPSWAQRWIASITLYPLVAVVEKRSVPLSRLHAPKRGTEWQPWGPK